MHSGGGGLSSSAGAVAAPAAVGRTHCHHVAHRRLGVGLRAESRVGAPGTLAGFVSLRPLAESRVGAPGTLAGLFLFKATGRVPSWGAWHPAGFVFVGVGVGGPMIAIRPFGRVPPRGGGAAEGGPRGHCGVQEGFALHLLVLVRGPVVLEFARPTGFPSPPHVWGAPRGVVLAVCGRLQASVAESPSCGGGAAGGRPRGCGPGRGGSRLCLALGARPPGPSPSFGAGGGPGCAWPSRARPLGPSPPVAWVCGPLLLVSFAGVWVGSPRIA